jgi:RNA polymerase-interacting CarD/CdnL/TRCF family regulator
MTDQLTVAQLIQLLQAIPNQNARVDMAMNQEYQDAVEASDINDYGDLVVIGQ